MTYAGEGTLAGWTFATGYVGEAPCGVLEWAWQCYGYKTIPDGTRPGVDSREGVACSGRTELEALTKCKKMAEKRGG